MRGLVLPFLPLAKGEEVTGRNAFYTATKSVEALAFSFQEGSETANYWSQGIMSAWCGVNGIDNSYLGRKGEWGKGEALWVLGRFPLETGAEKLMILFYISRMGE